MHSRIFGVCILFLCCWVQAISGQNREQKVVIGGTVTDKLSGETLPGASIYAKGTPAGTSADSKGTYRLSLRKGRYTIRCTFMGYRTQEATVNALSSETVDFQLEPGAHELEEVVVSSRARDANVKSVEMGIERMNMGEIKRLPMLMGEVDVLKVIQLLPGVQATAEGGSGFSVRGGSPDQNLILLDNTTVYNASHLFGFFSIFNNDVVSGLELYKGDLPLQTGGRLSSLLSVQTRSDAPGRFGGSGGIGLIASRLMLEGVAGKRTSWMIGGRRSYADLFFGLSTEETVKNSTLYFYDLNAKVAHQFSDRDKIEWNAYHGQDVFGAEMGKFNYGNTASSLLWRHRFSEELLSKFSVNLSDYRYRLGATFDRMDIRWGAGIFDVAVKADFNHHAGKRLNLTYGLSSVMHRLDPGAVSISGYQDYDLQSQKALEHGLYLSNEQQITDRLSLRYGLRWSVFQNLGGVTAYRYDANHEVADSIPHKAGNVYHTYNRLEPRIGAVYLLNERSSLKAHYAHNVQFIQLAENSASGSPLNVWFPASPNIRPQAVDIISAGYFRNFMDNLYETSVEAYYKDMKQVIDFAEHAELLMNQHLEGEIRTGTGRAYGIEWSVKKNTGKLTGFLNYTLSRSERTIPEVNGGRTYLAPYDKTHAVNIVLNYAFSKKIAASATWIFASGAPTTYPTGRFQVGGEYFPIYSGRNEYRKPAYHRLDLSLTYVPNPHSKKWLKGEWNFSVYNAYGRKNPWLITYSQTGASTPTAEMTYLFRFVPSITYNFKF
ncbi:MAG: TonB-dependent receptor [Tannerellaceae bacterium]|jgi:outer membrane cobalamin receptor|nr:TonB-dependent receptor [Tannerellaceae bacterium]